MDANLTIDTLAFKLVYSDLNGSLRKEVSRGVNLPEELTIRSRDTVQASTKLPARETVVKLDRHMSVADDTKVAPIEAYVVVRVPVDAGIASSDVLAAVQRLTSLLSDEATSGLDLKEEIFVNGEQ